MGGNTNVIIDALSTNLTKGLAVNSSAPFASFDTLPSPPTAGLSATTGNSPDGIWPLGHDGVTAAQRVFLSPFAEAPNATFGMRVYGWRAIFMPGAAQPPAAPVWIPFFIAEFLCTTSNKGGPANQGPSGPSPLVLKDTERLCDTITLAQGVLGPSGYINSTGPGTDLIAYIVMELTGARYFQFDFNVNPADQIAANVLWAKGP